VALPPVGREDAAGKDDLGAHGNMWGDAIGDSFGAGGLGLSGVGEAEAEKKRRGHRPRRHRHHRSRRWTGTGRASVRGTAGSRARTRCALPRYAKGPPR